MGEGVFQAEHTALASRGWRVRGEAWVLEHSKDAAAVRAQEEDAGREETG